MASKRRQRRRMCSRKKAYDRDGAINAAVYMRHHGQGRLHAYLCPVCGAYHVGHMPKHVSQSIRDRRERQSA